MEGEMTSKQTHTLMIFMCISYSRENGLKLNQLKIHNQELAINLSIMGPEL